MSGNNQSMGDTMVSAYLERLKNDKNDTEALQYLGSIALESGNHEEAKSFLGRLLALQPWNSEAQRLLQEVRLADRHVVLGDVVKSLAGALAATDLSHGAPAAKGVRSLSGSGVTPLKRPKILYLFLEFSSWRAARSWSYSAQLAYEEGLAANGVEVISIPAIYGLFPDFPASWLSRVQTLCTGQSFDQVWVELLHSPFDDRFLEWLKDIAPIRVGFIPESLEVSAELTTELNRASQYRAVVEHRLRYMTHALAVDDADADYINNHGLAKALWWPQAIPERCVCDELPPATDAKAAFPGQLYLWRRDFMGNAGLSDLLCTISGPEDTTAYPALFDVLQAETLVRLNSGVHLGYAELTRYMEVLRRVRRQCFDTWLGALRNAGALVNLKSTFHGYPGRVVESMAVGRPVVSCEVARRPRVNSLFTCGEEILFFNDEQPGELIVHLKRLRSDHEYGRMLAKNARKKIRSFHTVEKRVRQVLEWLETGLEPVYADAPEPDLESLKDAFRRSFAPDAERDIWSKVTPIAATPYDQLSMEQFMGMFSRHLENNETSRGLEMLESSLCSRPYMRGLLASFLLSCGNVSEAEKHNLIALTLAPYEQSDMQANLLFEACALADRKGYQKSAGMFFQRAKELGFSLERFPKFHHLAKFEA